MFGFTVPKCRFAGTRRSRSTCSALKSPPCRQRLEVADVSLDRADGQAGSRRNVGARPRRWRESRSDRRLRCGAVRLEVIDYSVGAIPARHSTLAEQGGLSLIAWYGQPRLASVAVDAGTRDHRQNALPSRAPSQAASIERRRRLRSAHNRPRPRRRPGNARAWTASKPLRSR